MAQWKPEPTPDQYRRGLYIVVQRTIPLPYLMIFDAPDGNAFCTRRDRSNTPTQALTLLNDPLFFECARHVGRRVVQRHQTTNERLQQAFLLTLGRTPSAEETDELNTFLAEQSKLLNKYPAFAGDIAGSSMGDVQETALWSCLARVLMNTDEFISRE